MIQSRTELTPRRPDAGRARRIMRALMFTLLLGFIVVRYAVRRYARQELFDPPGRTGRAALDGLR